MFSLVLAIDVEVIFSLHYLFKLLYEHIYEFMQVAVDSQVDSQVDIHVVPHMLDTLWSYCPILKATGSVPVPVYLVYTLTHMGGPHCDMWVAMVPTEHLDGPL